MASAKPTPAFIRRAIEGVREAGESPAAVEVKPDGSVVVLIVAKGEAAALPSPRSEGGADCDEVFGMVRGS